MTLRAAHRLAANATPVLDRAVAALRTAGIDITAAIDIEVDPAGDGDADLLLACGLLSIEMIDGGAAREIVAAPRFPGERAAVYRSVLVARDPIGLREAAAAPLAVNERGSWSGWHGVVSWLAASGLAVTGPRIETGSHLASVDAIRRGAAAVAAIDATVWRDLVDPDGLRVIATTDDWPAPPFSIATGLDPASADAIRTALVAQPDIEAARDDDYRFMLAARRPFT